MKRALVLLLLVAACGGGSGGKGDGGKAAHIAKAEALCAKANADLVTVKKDQPTSLAAVPPYVHRIVEIARKDVIALSALTPPASDAGDVKAKLLDPLRVQLTEADAYATKVDTAAGAKNQAALFDLVTHPPTKTRADLAWMRTYGFKACVTAADTGSTGK
ncbi:MAG: hypothetical protein QOE84_3453 [Actinomycetota bacterium]|nr:hypothetical protein [Actinomycetota bacterium]